MVQSQARLDEALKATPLPNLFLPEIGGLAKKRVEELAQFQSELLEQIQEVNRQWLDRMKSEATLASELANKLSSARSIPETATAYQKWASRRMEMAAEDAQRLLADGQKFAETGARLVSRGWLSGVSATGAHATKPAPTVS